ncbi:Ras GTPase activating protein ira2, partial [Cladochytrium tenue]
LPINSSVPISFLESDVGFNHNVKAVIELCPWRLWDVVGHLAAVLEEISNPQKLSQNQKIKTEAGIMSNELLHSRLLILRILSNCLAYYWKLFRESRDPDVHDHAEQSLHSVKLSYNGTSAHQSSPRPPRSNSDGGDDVHGRASSATTANPAIAGVRSLPDPPPLDEALARFILNALAPYFFTHTGLINPDNINHVNFTMSLASGGTAPLMAYTGLEDRENQQIANFYMQSGNNFYLPNPEMYSHPPGAEVFTEMQRIAGRIVFYISASNWPLVYARIKQRFLYLMSASSLNDTDEIGTVDVTELRYLEWCNPNKMRLSSVIVEFNNSFKSFSRKVQFLAAIVLRKCIWNWIETHPTEFVLTYQTQKRVEGPDDANYVDPRIVTDCLTTFLKLNPWNTLRTLMMSFFESQTPLSYSVILVRSCLEVVNENFPLPWNSGLDATLAAPLRRLFMKESMIIGMDDLRFLFASILSCLQDPSPQIRSAAADTIRVLLAPEFVASWDGTTPDWRQPLARPTESSMFVFWRTTSLTVNTLCRQLLDLRYASGSDNAMTYGFLIGLTKSTLDLLKDVLDRRNEFLKQSPELATVGSGLVDRTTATSALEKTLLILLCSPENDVVSSTIACIGLLVEEIELADGSSLGGPQVEIQGGADPSGASAAVLRRTRADLWTDGAGSPLSIVQNIHVYKELSGLFSGGSIIAGQKAVQKKIRKILRKTTQATSGNVAAWEEVYKRWRALCSSMLVPNRGLEINDDMGDRQNYTGFLCAMGAMSLHLPQSEPGVRSQTLGRPSASLSDSNSSGGSNNNNEIISKGVAQAFISELVTLMTCDNVAIREYVKDYLGNELSAAILDILITYCESIVTNYLNPDAANHERITFFVDSFISVLKMILDRSEEDAVTEQDFISLSGSVDFGTLILTFVHYLDRLNVHINLLPAIMRVRIKLCQLVEVIVSGKKVVSIKQDIRFRNRMLDVLVEWNSENLPGSRSVVIADLRAKNEKLIRDLDLAIMKTLVFLLRSLPLQPAVDNHQQTMNGDDEDLADSTNELKGKLFHKYLDFFLKTLHRVKSYEAAETKKLDMLNMSLDARIIASQARESLQNYMQPLKENAILSLSNLLSSNIEVGLRFSLSMGYHEDAKIRTAFMEVLTNLLESGAEQFEGLGEEGLVLHRRYEKLVEMIVSQDLAIPLALGEFSDGDDVAGVLISIFTSKGQVIRLLTTVIEQEVNRTDYSQNLFRRNSMATRLLAAFSRLCGHDYLVEALKPVFDEILAIKPTLTFEIDPARLTEFDDPSINLKNLKMLVKRLLDNIVGAQHHLPQDIRIVCHQLSVIVGRKYPDAQVTSVGAFIFLRFICPAIVAPETIGFATVESKDIRRGLILAIKVIQNLANNVLFGSKEDFMVDLNDLLKRNISRVHGFLRFVSNNDSSSLSNPGKPYPFPTDVSEYDLMRLHRVLALNIDKLESMALGARASDSRRQLFASLSTLIAQLGPAPDVNRLRLALISKEKNSRPNPLPTAQMYQDFILRVSSRPGIDKALEVIKEQMICYQHGVTKDGHEVVYYIARKVQPEAIDMELLMFHTLSVMSQAALRGAFDMVLDITYFSVDNEWDLQWIRRFEEIVPENVIMSLGRVFILNCNTHFKKFLTNVGRMLEIDSPRNVLFVSNIDELYGFIPSQLVKLPKSSFLDKDVTSVYSPVSKITNSRELIPVIIKVSADSVQVMSVQKSMVIGNEAVITDTYRFGDIIEVLPGSDASELTIKYAERVNLVYGAVTTGNVVSTILFSSPKRDAMVRDVRSAKAQHKKSRPTNIITDERNLRPADVPGTLLNMALLNLGSSDPTLRQTSYNLMVALAANFDLHVGNQLLGAK